MPSPELRVWFRRFVADYGMIFVLLLMCAVFSAATYRRQEPRGTAAGEQLAAMVVAAYPDGARVLILQRDTDEGREFVEALQMRLTEKNATVAGVAFGEPKDMRAAMEKAAAEGRVDAIACSRSIAELTLFENLGTKISALAETQVLTPRLYHWPDFLKTDNLRGVATRIAVIAIIAIGMTMVIITAGIDLSVGSLIAFSAVTCTWLIREAAGGREAHPWNMAACCLAAVLLCGTVGAFSGFMVTAFRIPAFIVTLSVMQIARGLAYEISDSQTIYQIPESFAEFGNGLLFGVPIPFLLMLALYVAAHVVMSRTVFGRYVYAVGGNPEAARLSGIPIKRIVCVCYVACGALAGLGGVITASQLNSGAAKYGQMAELEVIAAVVVGGASLAGGEGKIFGTLIGALLIGVMGNGMNLMGVHSRLQMVVLGLVILGAALLDSLRKNNWSLLRQMFRS